MKLLRIPLAKYKQAICSDLDITDRMPVHIVPMKNYLGYCNYPDCIGISNTHFFEKDRINVVYTLAHELRHWYQYQHNILGNQGKAFRWMGILKCLPRDATDKNYELRPWEIDANDYAGEFMTRIGYALVKEYEKI